MKKKLLTIIISLAAVLCLCFGTSACDNKTVVPDDGSHAEQGGVQGGSQDNNENDDNNNNKITFTVSFDTLGGSDVDPVSVSDGSKVKKPVEPSKEGYTFVEWQFEGQSWNFNRTIIRDITLVALWKANQYNINYHNIDGATNANPDQFTYDGELILKAAQKAGYKFNGWFSDSSCTTKVTSIDTHQSKEIDLWAEWDVIYYTATFKAEDIVVDTVSFTVEDEKLNHIPSVPAKEGHTGHWENYTIKPQDITINAVYEINKYTVTWKNYDGKILKIDQNVAYDTVPSYTGETPYKIGDTQISYSFVGWLPKPERINQDMEYFAQFSINSSGDHTISYDANGGVNASRFQIKKSGQTLKLSKEIPQNGTNIFMGWECAYDGKIYSAGSDFALDINATLYAVWGHECENCSGTGSVAERVKCSACSGRGTTTTQEWRQCTGCKGLGYLSYSATCTSCKGYGGAFLCSCSSGHQWYADQTGSRNCPYCGKSGSGSRITTCSTCSGSGTVKKQEPCKSCSGSGGSYYERSVDCASCDGGYTTNSHICSACQGEKQLRNSTETYNVTLVTEEGSSHSASVVYNSPYRLLVPTRIGYSFVGWFDDATNGTQYTDSEGVSFGVWDYENDMKLYAHWDIIQYTITYECDDENVYRDLPSSYTVENNNIVLPVPKRDYYNFVWQIDGKSVSEIDTNLVKNITVRGKWVPIEYSITYELDDGTAKNESAYTVESAEIKLNAPTKTGYTFLGWSSESFDGLQLEVTIPTGSHGNLTFTANWKLDNYEIIYILYGGKNSPKNPVSYTINDTIELHDASQEYYNFEGWFVDAEFTEQITSLHGRYGQLTLYAKFTPFSFDATFDAGEGNLIYKINLFYWENSDLNRELVCKGGEPFDPYALPDLSRDDYIFTGWYTDSGFKNPVTEGTLRQGELTLYAQWVMAKSIKGYNAQAEELTENGLNISAESYLNRPVIPQTEKSITSEKTKYFYVPFSYTGTSQLVYDVSADGHYSGYYGKAQAYLKDLTANKYVYNQTVNSYRTYSGTQEIVLVPGHYYALYCYSYGYTYYAPVASGYLDANADASLRVENVLLEKSCQIEFSDTISELFGTKTTYPLAEKKGYDFVGWFDQNGEPISEEWTYTSSQTFHAEWVLHDNLITYNLFDGTNDIDNMVRHFVPDRI